jgi:hypothetical protein
MNERLRRSPYRGLNTLDCLCTAATGGTVATPTLCLDTDMTTIPAEWSSAPLEVQRHGSTVVSYLNNYLPKYTSLELAAWHGMHGMAMEGLHFCNDRLGRVEAGGGERSSIAPTSAAADPCTYV